MHRFRLIFLICMFLLALPVSQAQDSFLPALEVITADNLHQVEQITMFHRGTIEEMAWSPDSAKLATAGSAGGWIYDVNNMQADPVHFAKTLRLTDVDFHPGGERVIAVSEDAIHEWDVETGELIRQISLKELITDCYGCPAYGKTVKYSLDGQYITAGSLIGGLILFDVKTGDLIGKWDNRIYEIFYSPDGQYIAAITGGSPTDITILSVQELVKGDSPLVVYLKDELRLEIGNFIWTDDSETLVVTGENTKNIYQYDLLTDEVSIFTESDGWGNGITFASDRVISVSSVPADGDWSFYVDFRNRATAEHIKRFEVPRYVTDIRSSPNEEFLAIAFNNGRIEIRDMEGRYLQVVTGSAEMIEDVDLVSDDYLLTMETTQYDCYGCQICADNTLRLWDLRSGMEVRSWSTSTNDFGHFGCHATVIPASQQVLLTLDTEYEEEKEIIILDLVTSDIFEMQLPYPPNDKSYSFQWARLSSTGQFLGIYVNQASGADIHIYDVSAGLNLHDSPVQTISIPTYEFQGFVFAGDDDSIIVVSDSSELSRWNITTGEEIETVELEVPPKTIWIDLAISPDKSVLALNSYNMSLRFFDTSDLSLIDTWEREEYLTEEQIETEIGVYSAGITTHYGKQNNWLVTFNSLNSYSHYRLWRIDDLVSFPLPVNSWYNNIAFSQNGKFFVTGGNDGAIRIWGVPAEP